MPRRSAAPDPLDDCEVLDLVDSLVDKSMVLAQRNDGRAFSVAGDASPVRRGAARSFAARQRRHVIIKWPTILEQVHEYGRLVLSSRQLDGTAKFSLEWDNLQALHQWALASEDLDVAEGLIDNTADDAFTRMAHEHTPNGLNEPSNSRRIHGALVGTRYSAYGHIGSVFKVTRSSDEDHAARDRCRTMAR